jgi:ABC-type sugar transport system ATPase subunit
MATITLIDVLKDFSGRASRSDPANLRPGRDSGPALDHINLTIPNGTTMAIVGPSGCGKSTLLRVIAGLEPAYSGQVLYNGQDMRDKLPKDRHIGMVFQNYALYPHFEGHGNLNFFFRVHRAPDHEAEERIRVTSEIMGISFKSLLRRKPGTFSGGEQQRLALARALVRNPDLFLLDEPLSNLDAKLRTQTRIEIKRLIRRFQITTIYVTHDQVEAVTLGDQIAVMRAGQIEQVGSFETLRHRPVNTFVAGFLGHPPMNLLAGGKVVDKMLQLGPATIPLPAPLLTRLKPGQLITLGIRPEEARLRTSTSPATNGFQLEGQIEVVEPDFAHQTQLVYVRNGSLSFVATGPLDPALTSQTSVSVFFPYEQLHFFDEASERRIS